MLRPIGSPMPLGAFALVPSGLLLSALQLGWLASSDRRAVAFILLGFAVPLQLVSSVFAFLSRDALVGTSFGIFAGIWLAFALTEISGSVGQTSHVLGIFFLACGALFILLVGGGFAGGKVGAGAVILAGSARFVLSGIYELSADSAVEDAAGIVGLAFVCVAAYVGLARVLEDSARRLGLPLGRRGVARAALAGRLDDQLRELEHEAGVRQQL